MIQLVYHTLALSITPSASEDLGFLSMSHPERSLVGSTKLWAIKDTALVGVIMEVNAIKYE